MHRPASILPAQDFYPKGLMGICAAMKPLMIKDLLKFGSKS
jgi:hypothetical protein